MYHKSNSRLAGLKFIDKNGKSLLVAGRIEMPNYINNAGYPIKEFVLQDGERIIGMTSGARNNTCG
jgi:hypothetical protein